nr:hypothetical protein [Tanacetum cinerariifolium]
MIPGPGDANRDINVTETFHLQTDDELSDKELKQIKADDQAIQTILLGLPEDIYAAEKKAKLFNEWERFTSNEEESIESYYHRFLKLMNDLKRNKHFPEKIATFKLNYSTPTNNNQRISSNPRNRQIIQPGMNMDQDRQMQMIGGNDGNQFRQYAGQNARNPAGYNDVIGNQVIQNAIQNPRVQNEEVGIQLQAEEYDLMAAAADLDEIEEVNANCILMVNLQQASTPGTQTDSAPIYDTDGSAEVHEN